MNMSAHEPLLEGEAVAFGEEQMDGSTDKNTLTHPYVTFFHLLFRSASIVVYMLCNWFSESFITNFVVIILLLSMDFWTVKNVTGRLMVGLRWWNYVDEEGISHWVFESGKDQVRNRISEREASIFWLGLFVAPLLWCVFFIIELFGLNLKWLLVVIIALILNGANLYGYLKCKIGANESITSATTGFFRKQVLQNAASLVARQNATPQSNSTIPVI